MNQKSFIILCILLVQYSVIQAQIYQSGLNTKADDLIDLADSLFNIASFSESKIYYDKALPLISFQESKAHKQNALFIKLRLIECSLDLEEKHLLFVSLDSLQEIISIDFNKESLLDAYACFLKGSTSSSFEEALKYYNKAGEIWEKKLQPNQGDLVRLSEKLVLTYRSLKQQNSARKYAYNFLNQALKMEPGDTAMVVKAYSTLGAQYYVEHDYETSQKYLDTSYQWARKHLAPNHRHLRTASSNLAIIYNKLGDKEKQLKYLNETIRLYDNTNEKVDKSNLISAYSALSNFYFSKNEIKKSKHYLDSVKVLLDQLPKPNYNREVLYRIRASNMEQKLSKRIFHLEKALAILDVYPYINVSNEAGIYNNLALAYNDLGVDDKWKLYLDKTLDLYQTKAPNYHDGLASVLLNLSAYYLEKDSLDEALKLNAGSFAARRKGSKERRYLEPTHWFQLISIAMEKADFKSAKVYLDSSYQILKTLELDPSHHQWRDWHLKKAKLNLKDGLLDSALHHIDLTIEIQSEDISYGFLNNIEPYKTKYKILLETKKTQKVEAFLRNSLKQFGILKEGGNWSVQNTLRFNLWEGFSLYQLYQTEYLHLMGKEEAINFIKAGMVLISKIRTYYFDDIGELDFYKSVKRYIDHSIQYLFLCSQEEDRATCQKLLFDLVILNRDIRTSKGLQFSNGSPKNRKEIDAYLVKSNMLQQKLKLLNKDDTNYIIVREELLAFEHGWINQFTKKGDQDFQLEQDKFNQIETFRKVLGDAQALMFYIGEKHIYKIGLCNDEFLLDRFPKDKIEHLINSIIPLLSDWSTQSEEQSKKNASHLISSIDTLSKILIDATCDSKNLLVYPDGILLNLPFDILFTESPKGNKAFRDLPYLIREKRISYASSINKLVTAKSEKTNSQSYLGFAPSYSDRKMSSEVRTPQAHLYFNQLEVSQSNGFMQNGKIILGKEATKSKFLSEINNVDWLHLAAHAKYNHEISYLSYLSFANHDGIESKLYAHEIADLNLDIDLAVLSACETNKGNVKNGLGLLGIARAFQIAGCNNLIITNWLVDDAASQQLVSEFFRKKVEGSNGPDALRNAKISYLDQAPEALSHPIYWAGFNYYGAINFSDSKQNIWWLAIPILFLVFLFLKKLK